VAAPPSDPDDGPSHHDERADRAVVRGVAEVSALIQRSTDAASSSRIITREDRLAIVLYGDDGEPVSVLTFGVVDGRITEVDEVTDPGRLARMDLPPPCSGRS
jgi:hypothetical protein